MKKQYRLKSELKSFLPAPYHLATKPLDWWQKEGIRLEFLTCVDRCHIEIGSHDNKSGKGYAGWSSDGNKAYFDFVLRISDLNIKDYESINIRKLLEEMEKAAKACLKLK